MAIFGLRSRDGAAAHHRSDAFMSSTSSAAPYGPRGSVNITWADANRSGGSWDPTGQPIDHKTTHLSGRNVVRTTTLVGPNRTEREPSPRTPLAQIAGSRAVKYVGTARCGRALCATGGGPLLLSRSSVEPMVDYRHGHYTCLGTKGRRRPRFRPARLL